MPPPGPSGGPPPPAALDCVFKGIHALGELAAVEAAEAYVTGGGGGGGGGGGSCLPGIIPGDLPKSGGPLPNATPPGALTALCRHAVDGGSSSALSGRTRLPLTHRAPGMGDCGACARGRTSAFSNSSCCSAVRAGSTRNLDHLLRACCQIVHIHHLLL